MKYCTKEYCLESESILSIENNRYGCLFSDDDVRYPTLFNIFARMFSYGIRPSSIYIYHAQINQQSKEIIQRWKEIRSLLTYLMLHYSRAQRSIWICRRCYFDLFALEDIQFCEVYQSLCVPLFTWAAKCLLSFSWLLTFGFCYTFDCYRLQVDCYFNVT